MGVHQVRSSAQVNFWPCRRGRPTFVTDRWRRIGIEATVAPQPDEHGDLLPIEFRQFASEGLGIIASVEDEQRDWPVRGQALHKLPDLCRGDRVGVATGLDSLHIQRRRPAVMSKAELCQPGIRPAGDDRLTRRLTRRRVIVGAAWAGLRVVARPDAGVQRIDGLPIVQRIACDQLPQRRSINVAGSQGVIQTAPPTPMDRRQTQVGQRWHEPSHRGGVQQLEQSVAPRIKSSSYTPARNCRRVFNVAGSIMPDPTGQNRPMSRNRAHLPFGVKSQAKGL